MLYWSVGLIVAMVLVYWAIGLQSGAEAEAAGHGHGSHGGHGHGGHGHDDHGH